jgi:hypothetical protein
MEDRNQSMKRFRRAAKGRLLWAGYALRDRRENRIWHNAKEGPKFLIVRHPGKAPYTHNYFLQWIAKTAPHLRQDFELQLLPHRCKSPEQYSLMAGWLQDPAEDWMDRRSYEGILRLENQFRSANRTVLNPVECLTAGVKSSSSKLFQQHGVRTPRVEPIRNPQSFDPYEIGLQYPIIIREDRRHAGPMFHLRSTDDLSKVDWSQFESPVAAEYIDVRDPNDGLYRKYRFVSAGDFGVPRHLIVSKAWEVRAEVRVRDRITQREELAYGETPDPNFETLQGLRRAMGIDLVAFDYSYDRSGRLVVWEANAYANLSFPVGPNVEYTRPMVERSYAAIAAMYYRKSGLPIDPVLKSHLGNCYVPPSVASTSPTLLAG